jgi:hypothetical protein
MKIRLEKAELFHTDGRIADRQTDMTYPIVAFHNVANPLKTTESVKCSSFFVSNATGHLRAKAM